MPQTFELGLYTDFEILFPNGHELYSAYPNPFNSNVIIPFYLISKENVNLNIFNLEGKNIETLINRQVMNQGIHKVEWNANTYATGVYLYTLEVGNDRQSKKIIYLK